MNGMHDISVLAWRIVLAAILGAAIGYRRGQPFHAAPFALFSLGAAAYAVVYIELGVTDRRLDTVAEFYFWMLAPFCLFMRSQFSRPPAGTIRLIAASVLAIACGTMAGYGYVWAAILLCCCAALVRALLGLRKGKGRHIGS